MATITDTVNKPAADRNLWLRLLFSLFYFVIGFYVVKVIMAVIVIMQFIFELLQGDINRRLCRIGSQLARYEAQIVLFLSHNSQVRPYPFAEWPHADNRSAGSE